MIPLVDKARLSKIYTPERNCHWLENAENLKFVDENVNAIAKKVFLSVFTDLNRVFIKKYKNFFVLLRVSSDAQKKSEV
jgi:hypothetical protein